MTWDVAAFPDLVLATVKSCRSRWHLPTYSGQESVYNVAGGADTEASAVTLTLATSVRRADSSKDEAHKGGDSGKGSPREMYNDHDNIVLA